MLTQMCWVSCAQVSPRADIFRRDQGAVRTLDDLKHVMRYNNWQKDTFSNGHPVASVCSRGDLAKTGAVPKGCYDTKVCSECWISGKMQEVSEEIWGASLSCFPCSLASGLLLLDALHEWSTCLSRPQDGWLVQLRQ